MKTLILMRHAKSAWDEPGLSDQERPLNLRGRQAAGALGTWLEDTGNTPELALVSSAIRTQETWSRVASQLTEDARMELVEALYLASPERILDIIRRKGGAAETILVLAHNPGCHQLARQLIDSPAEAPTRYPTGATSVFDFEVDDWRDVAPGTGRLQDFVVPRELVT